MFETLHIRVIFVLCLSVTSSLEIGTFLKKQLVQILIQDIMETWTGHSVISCALHCERKEQCKFAALKDTGECLFLKNVSSIQTEDQEEQVLKVTILKEMEKNQNKSNGEDENDLVSINQKNQSKESEANSSGGFIS